MSEPANHDLLIALKALLYVHDRSSSINYGILNPVLDFARSTIDAMEQRPENKSLKINGVPEGWYAPVANGEIEHPISLLKAAAARHGKRLFDDYAFEAADIDAYLAKTLLGESEENAPKM